MAADNETPRQRANEKYCDNAIKRTLAYSGIFNYPLSKYQIYNFLITRKEFSTDFFEKSITRLIKKNHIKTKGKRYYLAGVRPVSWTLREKYSKEFYEEAENIANFLKMIPFIKMAAVTGSVAAQNAKKEDDIDLFVITEKDRLWLTRIFTVLILKIINKYPTTKNTSNKVCCNLYMDESKMEWPESKQNIYIAREIINMMPVINRDETYFKFVSKNEWVLKYFRNFKITPMEKISKYKNAKSGFIDFLENKLRDMQIDYMKNKKTTEVTTKHIIHFNKNSHEEEILNNYQTASETL